MRPFGTLCSSNPSESREADEELNRSAVFKSTEQTFEVSTINMDPFSFRDKSPFEIFVSA